MIRTEAVTDITLHFCSSHLWFLAGGKGIPPQRQSVCVRPWGRGQARGVRSWGWMDLGSHGAGLSWLGRSSLAMW
jgi:hypothetical protein